MINYWGIGGVSFLGLLVLAALVHDLILLRRDKREATLANLDAAIRGRGNGGLR